MNTTVRDTTTQALDTSWTSVVQQIDRRLLSLYERRHLTPVTGEYLIRASILAWLHYRLPELDETLRVFVRTALSEYGEPPAVNPYETITGSVNDTNLVDSATTMIENNLRHSIARTIARVVPLLAPFSEVVPVSQRDVLITKITDTLISATRAFDAMIKSEENRLINEGRLAYWSADARKEWYEYCWLCKHDGKAKDISLVFEAGSPYTLSEIRRLWTVDHRTPQRVQNTNRDKIEIQESHFNCRCELYRKPKSAEQLYNEGLTSRSEL